MPHRTGGAELQRAMRREVRAQDSRTTQAARAAAARRSPAGCTRVGQVGVGARGGALAPRGVQAVLEDVGVYPADHGCRKHARIAVSTMERSGRPRVFFFSVPDLMLKFCKNLAGPCGAPTYLPTYLTYGKLKKKSAA